MLFKVMLACVSVILSTTATIPPGKCPEFAATLNLNLEKYAEGKWYLLARSARNDWYNCTNYEMKVRPEQFATRHNFDANGHMSSMDYTFEVDVENGRFVFPTIRFDGEPLKAFVNTDYEHYSLYYDCKENTDGTIEEIAYLKAREDSIFINHSILQAAKKLLADSGSKIMELHLINRKNCPL